MRTLAIRLTALMFVAVLVFAIAVVGLGTGQPHPIQTRSGPVPDVECPPGVSPAETFCYTTGVPVPGAPKPSDVELPQGPGASNMPYAGG